MVAWFIIAIATLAVFAFIAINGVQTVASTTDGVGRVETARRLDAAANALIARAGSPSNTGKYFVMAGTTVDSVYGLPPELSSYAYTPFGQRIVYCPFGDGESGSSAGAVPSGGGATYPIETKADSTGRVFVTAGRPNFPQVSDNPNLMGYLVAPRTKTSATPTCSSVRFNTVTKRFEAPDAFVRPIIKSATGEDARDAAAREVVFYVTPSGSGRGLAPNDSTNLQTALTYYKTRQPSNMRIILADGTYQLQAGTLGRMYGGFANTGAKSNLSIINGNDNAYIDQSSIAWINVPGNLYLRGLTLDSDSYLMADDGNTITTQSTTVGLVRVTGGGQFNMSDGAINAPPSDWGILTWGGGKTRLAGNIRVNLGGATKRYGIYTAGGGLTSVEGANLTYNILGGADWAFQIAPNGQLELRNAVITFNGTMTYGIGVVGGDVSMIGSNVLYSDSSSYSAVYLSGGGSLYMSDGVIGSASARPRYGIVDDGSRFLGGNTPINANYQCWTNNYSPQLIYSGNGYANGTSSVVTGDETVPGMSAAPTSAEVKAYTEAQARNQQRAMVRVTNQSSYACRM
jgi:hypothetical protein